jgi:LPXTG-motif cell wall-anchored protein
MTFGETVRSRRIIGFLVAVATSVLVAPAAALADPYPAAPPPSSVSRGTVSEGGTVTFSGRGFLPFEKISIVIRFAGSNSTAALQQNSADGFVLAAVWLSRRSALVITADRTGAFSVELSLTQVGRAALVATGLTSGVTVTAYVEVVTPTDRHDGGGGERGGPSHHDDSANLPTTGHSGTTLLLTVSSGAAAVLVGGGLLLFVRRRRDNTE